MILPTRRAYADAEPGDGLRILVERLWPRGLSKEDAQIDVWLKGVAPSDELRRWFDHDPEKWDEFKERYFEELDANPDAVDELRGHLARGEATLIYGSKEERCNSANALAEYLDARA